MSSTAALNRPQPGEPVGSFTISIEPVAIDASPEVVWSVLTDLPRYPDWNPFTVRVESTLEVGDPVVLHIRRGKNIMKQTFVLETFDRPREIAWRLPKILHPKVFNAFRTQIIEPVDDRSCRYITRDTFRGWIAGKLYRGQKDWVERNFQRLAAALKATAEAKAAQSA